jgi:hypothetical protein
MSGAITSFFSRFGMWKHMFYNIKELFHSEAYFLIEDLSLFAHFIVDLWNNSTKQRRFLVK